MSRIITMTDDKGIQREAHIISLFQYQNQKYLLYQIERNESTTNIFVSKINQETDQIPLKDIDDPGEKQDITEKIKQIFSLVSKGESFPNELSNNVIFLPDDSFSLTNAHFSISKTYVFTSKKNLTEKVTNQLDSLIVKPQISIIPLVDIKQEINLLAAIEKQAKKARKLQAKAATNHPKTINFINRNPHFQEGTVETIKTKDSTVMEVDKDTTKQIYYKLQGMPSKLSTQDLSAKKLTAKSLTKKPIPTSKAGYVSSNVLMVISGVMIAIITVFTTIFILKRVLP